MNTVQKAQDWQPWQTAPQIGMFLVFMPSEIEPNRVQCAKWQGTKLIIGEEIYLFCKPATHWMPMPDPPQDVPVDTDVWTQYLEAWIGDAAVSELRKRFIAN